MTTLHLVFGPVRFDMEGLPQGGKFALPGDTVVLMNVDDTAHIPTLPADGVQWLMVAAPDDQPRRAESPMNSQQISPLNSSMSALARISYEELVGLVVDHDSVVSWD